MRKIPVLILSLLSALAFVTASSAAGISSEAESALPVSAFEEEASAAAVSRNDICFENRSELKITAEECAKITEAMEYFTLKTGVGAGLLIENDSGYDPGTVSDETADIYTELFPDSENRMLVRLFIGQPFYVYDDYSLQTDFFAGADVPADLADGFVQTLYVHLGDDFYYYGSIAKPAARAFEDTADDYAAFGLYGEEKSENGFEYDGFIDDYYIPESKDNYNALAAAFPGFIFAVTVFAVNIGIFVTFFVTVRKNRQKRNIPRSTLMNGMPVNEQNHNQQPASYSDLPDVQSSVHSQNSDRIRFPVTCPSCRATAYPNEDGTCQYCGRKL